ncbi:MAG: hypothetical protein K0R29_1449 [Pseudobdellovibrio sp.]|jgi:hypothetical protein|nr:hypothetical protein [Pseudobdellovibrio sp.]
MPVRIKLFLTLLFATFLWPNVSFCGPMHENISVVLKLTGDLTGQFDLSGPLNQIIKSETEASGGCEAQLLFRKVKSKGKQMLEAWPTFICTRDGQKKTYKLHRSYLDPALETQQVTLKYLDEKIQNVSMEFRDLSLQKGK